VLGSLLLRFAPVSLVKLENDVAKRLVWSGLLAGVGAVASIVTTRVAALIYQRVFGEDPPE